MSKCQLIDSVVGGTLQFWMSHFILPSGIIKEVEKICNDFLWGKTDKQTRAKVAWKIVSKPKQEGGLGLKDMKIWNKANVIRHIWNVLLQEGSLWVAWIMKYRLKGRCFWTVKVSTGSWHWIKLLKLRSLVRSFITKDREGDLLWNGNIMKKCKVSNVWNDIRPTNQRVPWYDAVWTGFIIPRRSVVTWLIVLGRIYTKDVVKQWNAAVDEMCVLCHAAKETQSHLFSECEYYVAVASVLLGEIVGKDWTDVIQEVCSLKNVGTKGKTKMLLWRVMISHIWIERCKRVFGGARHEADSLIHMISDEIQTFAQGRKAEREILSVIS